jgi:hypothetical protein
MQNVACARQHIALPCPSRDKLTAFGGMIDGVLVEREARVGRSCNAVLQCTRLAVEGGQLHRSFRRRNAHGMRPPRASPTSRSLIPPRPARSDMKSSTGEQVRVHRALLHRRVLVERVLPRGAPPFHDDVAAADTATSVRRLDDRSPLDCLGPRGRSASVTLVNDGRDGFEEPRQRGDLQRSSWVRYLMNVHLMWVD